MFSEIIASIRTAEDAALIRDEVEEIKTALFKTESNVSEILDTKIRATFRSHFESIIHSSNPGEQLDAIVYAIQDMQPIEIVIAFQPTTAFIQNIYNQIAEDHEKFYLNISYNPMIIGGAQISFNGRFKDSTVLKKIRQTLTENSDDLQTIMNKYNYGGEVSKTP